MLQRRLQRQGFCPYRGCETSWLGLHVMTSAAMLISWWEANCLFPASLLTSTYTDPLATNVRLPNVLLVAIVFTLPTIDITSHCYG